MGREGELEIGMGQSGRGRLREGKVKKEARKEGGGRGERMEDLQ